MKCIGGSVDIQEGGSSKWKRRKVWILDETGMIPVVKKDPPTELEHVKRAIRDLTQFTVANMDASGRHSTYRANYFIQCNAKLIALYDKDAEQWFIDATQHELDKAWTASVVLEALGKDAVINVNYAMLKSIQRHGYVSVVRKRIGVSTKEK